MIIFELQQLVEQLEDLNEQEWLFLVNLEKLEETRDVSTVTLKVRKDTPKSRCIWSGLSLGC